MNKAATFERAFDVALGLSALSWAVLGVLRAEGRPLSIRLAIGGLNLVVAALFLSRRVAVAHAPPSAIVAALPSMILGAAAVRLSDEVAWTIGAEVLFVAGALGSALVLIRLGRSFAFLPARRELIVRSPYALVRHPAYACELAMLIACAIVRPWPNAPIAAAALGALVLRIAAEERVLAGDPGWDEYRARVRWRLVPFVH